MLNIFKKSMAERLENNRRKFIDKSVKDLLRQGKHEIKYLFMSRYCSLYPPNCCESSQKEICEAVVNELSRLYGNAIEVRVAEYGLGKNYMVFIKQKER